MAETWDFGTLVFNTFDDDDDCETDDEDIVMNPATETEDPLSCDELGWPGNSPDTVVDRPSEDDKAEASFILKLGSSEKPEWADDSKFLQAKTLEDAYAILEREGIVVLLNQFSAAECKQFVTDSATLLTDMSLVSAIEDYKDGTEGTQKIWIPSSVYDVSVSPPAAKYGCYKTVANGGHQWSVRSSKQLHDAFKHFYNCMAGRDVGDMFASMDGLIFHPDSCESEQLFVDSYYTDRTIASTAANRDFFTKHDFINAQCSFSNSQCAFICCPRTHKYYDQFKGLIRKQGIIPKYSLTKARRKLNPLDDAKWNTRVWVPAGAVVFWDARLIVSSVLSATVSDELVEAMNLGLATIGDWKANLEPPQIVSSADEAKKWLNFDYGPAYDAGFFDGWRCALTVSLTPKDFHCPHAAEMEKKLRVALRTNHAVPRTAILGGKYDGYRAPTKQTIYQRKYRHAANIYRYMHRRPEYESIRHLIEYNITKRTATRPQRAQTRVTRTRSTQPRRTPTHITKKTWTKK